MLPDDMSEQTLPPARRRDPARVQPHAGTRVEEFARGAELGSVATVLVASRDEILRRWLEVARAQPFHAAHPDQAVADHIPQLYDALVAFLQRAAPRSIDPSPPLDDHGVHDAARGHARDRFRQGLRAADVLTEFRLLRQEIGRALRQHPVTARLAADVLGAELLVHDALDGAATLALAALGAQEEERDRLAAALDRQRRLLEAALVQAPSGVTIAEAPSGRIISHNPEADRLLRHPMLETEDDGDDARHGAMHADGTPYAPEEYPMARAVRGETIRDHEMRYRRGDGTETYFSVNAAPVHDADGAIVAAISTFYDVSARKRAEVEQEELLGVLAHDLKNPLTLIKGSADLLQRRVASGQIDPERMAERLGSISATAERMALQLTDLVDVLRLREGRLLELVRRPVDLVPLAYRVATLVQETTDRHEVDVEVRTPELVGEWDGFRLERVLGNLLSNAVKYSPEGGPVALRIERAGDEAVLTVSDRGIGIPPADLPHVFERYHRGSNVVGRIRGEGIGLAGARQIVEQHGGTIAVESREGEGTAFTVRLPLA